MLLNPLCMYKTMRCIFCKEDSSLCKSVEHIIPESLGGNANILRKGIVCDKCNNYFAREVEKPFLDNPAITLLRFEEGLPNKKKIILSVSAVINGKYPITLWKDLDSEFVGHIDITKDAYNSVLNQGKSTIIFPAFNDSLPLPNDSIISRFIGKIAIEAFAQRIINNSHIGLDSFIDDTEFDLLRNHVRRGCPTNWDYHKRRVYDIDKKWIDPHTKETYQVINEFDFLLTEEHECYFILILFGIEFAINIVGSTVEGYKKWLDVNNNQSPLYTGKNSGHKMCHYSVAYFLFSS